MAIASVGATRSSRSSTLPSQQTPQPRHRYRHRYHQSASHKTGSHAHQSLAQNSAYLATPISNTSSLQPLGELLNPVRRNVAEGLSGVPSWLDREKDKDRWRGSSGEEMPTETQDIPEITRIDPEQFEQSRRKRKAAERSVEEHYNVLADQALLQHAALADSRISMVRMFNRLDSTLSSLSKLHAEVDILLGTLTQESIPELTDESTKQLSTFRATMSDIETNRITKLQTVINTARENTTKLGTRIVDVRSRLRAWEEKEMEDDKQRRRRVGFIWGTIAVMLALTVLLLIWGRMNEQLEAREFLAQNWTEIVIEKAANRDHVNGSEIALAELLRSLQEDDFDRTSRLTEKLPGEDSGSEQDDGLLSSIFDEL